MEKSEELLQKRLLDLANHAEQRNIAVFSDFLNLGELNILHNMSQEFSGIRRKTFGGYELAERQIAAFIPDALYYEWDYPISCLKIQPLNAKFTRPLTHRDYLGAILNLGINRGKTGDILIDQETAYLFCVNTMSDFICQELNRIHHVSVFCEEMKKGLEFNIPLKTITVKGSVASVRLDSVLSLACNESRNSLVNLIEGGKVSVNGKLIVSNGYHLREGDLISIKGVGRFRYLHVLSRTKKGRSFIELLKYI